MLRMESTYGIAYITHGINHGIPYRIYSIYSETKSETWTFAKGYHPCSRKACKHTSRKPENSRKETTPAQEKHAMMTLESWIVAIKSWIVRLRESWQSNRDRVSWNTNNLPSNALTTVQCPDYYTVPQLIYNASTGLQSPDCYMTTARDPKQHI